MRMISLSALLSTADDVLEKTALINEFCKDKPTIFSALNTTERKIWRLSKSIMSFERPDMESAPEFRSS